MGKLIPAETRTPALVNFKWYTRNSKSLFYLRRVLVRAHWPDATCITQAMDGESIPEECYDLPPYTEDLLADLEPEPSAKRARTDTLSPVSSTSGSGRFETRDTQTLYTLKVSYDPSWVYEDYVKICESLFTDSPKILVVAEKMHVNSHVHFHGYSYYADATFKKKAPALIKPLHYTQKVGTPAYNKKARPVQGMGCVATELGFQYLCKEPPNAVAPLYQRGFTPEELMELHAKSQDFVKELKFNTRDFITSLELPKGDPPAVYQQILMLVAEKLAQEHKDKTRYTRLDIQNGLLHHPQATPKMRGYILSLN